MEEMTNIIPSMRFDEFKYSWKVTTLGEITRQYRESNKNVHHQNLLSLSYGKIVRKDIESKKGLLPASFDTYQIIKKDIIVFRVTDLQNDKKSLRVGISEEEGIITPAYVCMECDTRAVDPHYLYTLLHYYDDITKVYYKMGDGMRQTLAYSDLKELKVYLPSFSEQHKIVECFKSLDKQIQLSSKKIASLRQMKTASLQVMYPQKGETRPRVRFKGFEGDWEEKAFNDITFHAGVKNRENLPLESYSISNEHGFIPQNEQFENGGTMSSADKRMYYIVSPNSFAYNPARINVGSLGYYRGEKDVIVSSLYEVFKTTKDINDIFLFYWFKTNVFNKMIELYQEGGVRLYFFYDKLCQCSAMVPSIEEQSMIANYFTTIDKQISLEEQKLESLKRIKSACLDKMFV